MTSTRPHPADVELDQEPFDRAALYAAQSLSVRGFALLEFAPGDATLYRLSIIDSRHGAMHEDGRITGDNMGGNRYLVASTFGHLYAWSGQPMERDFVHEHYVTDERGSWTAAVYTRLFRAISEALAQINAFGGTPSEPLPDGAEWTR